jgi:hypothetical protein
MKIAFGRARPIPRRWVAGTVLLLAACGGGGGATGGGTAPVAPTVLASDAGVYLPATAPTKHFRGVDTRTTSPWPAESYGHVERWTGAGSARSVSESNPLNANTGAMPTNANYAIGADGVHDLSGSFLVDDALILRSPVVAGDRYTVVDKTVSVPDADGDGSPETVSVRVDVEVVGARAVSVPAGTFANAVQVVTSATLQLTASKAGVQPPIALTSTDWLVPEIGRVKTVFVDGSAQPGLQGTTVTEELAGYRDTTRAFGAAAARPLFDQPFKTKSPPAIASSGGVALVAAAISDALLSNTIDQFGAVMGTRVDSAGIPGPTLTLFQSAGHGGFAPALADDGAGGYVVVTGNRLGLLAQRVAADGSVRDGRSGVSIHESANWVLTPVLSRLGDRLLLAWSERSSSGQVIRAMLIDATSAQPTSSPLTIASPTGYAGFPRLATDGQGWLLVFSAWADGSNYGEARAYSATLHAVRLDGTATVLDSAPRALSEAGTAHSVAEVRFDGSNYVVAWADNRNHLGAPNHGTVPPQDAYTGTYMQDIFMTRLVPATGEVVTGMPATGESITSIAAYRDSPALAFVGTRALEVHNVFDTSASHGIYYRWLETPLSSAAAQVADNRDAVANLGTFHYPAATYGQSVAAVHGMGALVAFMGDAGSTGYPEIHFTFVLPPAP